MIIDLASQQILLLVVASVFVVVIGLSKQHLGGKKLLSTELLMLANFL
jgi:hypothetical protein